MPLNVTPGLLFGSSTSKFKGDGRLHGRNVFNTTEFGRNRQQYRLGNNIDGAGIGSQPPGGGAHFGGRWNMLVAEGTSLLSDARHQTLPYTSQPVTKVSLQIELQLITMNAIFLRPP